MSSLAYVLCFVAASRVSLNDRFPGFLHRQLQLPAGGPSVYSGRRLLLQHGVRARHHPGDELLHHVLARVERSSGQGHDRGHHDAQLFHHLQQFQIDSPCGVTPQCHEHVGQRVYVLHLRVAARVCFGQLRREEKTQAQYSLHARGERSHTGQAFYCYYYRYNIIIIIRQVR